MCSAACSHEHDACPSETVEGCVYTCAKTGNKYPGCSGELHTLLECQSKVPVSCKAGGGVDFGTACDGETVSYAQCAACEITPKDSLCAACSKDNCCKESRALVAAPGGAAYESCTKACKNAPACTEQCKQSYPEAATAASVVGACVTSSCPASCQTGAPGDDTLSIYCKKALETGCSGSATLGGCLKQVRIDAAISGCEGAYYQKLSCAIENGISCTAGEIDLGIACNAFFESSCSP